MLPAAPPLAVSGTADRSGKNMRPYHARPTPVPASAGSTTCANGVEFNNDDFKGAIEIPIEFQGRF
jgi:hypothetical protein